LHAFGVNSDDNFRLTECNVQIGEFNWVTGRGAADTVMRFYAPVEGLYPIRLVYDQGTGGGNVEWWAVDSTAETIVPINTGAYEAFRPTDLDPPVMNCPQALTGECGVPVNYGATAFDAVDGPVPVICTPTNGSVLPMGETNVTCTAQDGFGNVATCSFIVTVTDTVPPVLTCPTNVLVFECAGANGRIVDYSSSVAASDCSAFTLDCVPASGTVFGLGDTPVTCTAYDVVLNTNICTFIVRVSEGDTTAPVLTCPVVPATECAGPNGTAVGFQVTAVDNCDPTVAVNCTPAAGSLFPLGPTTVTCTATDVAGNTGRCDFVVSVVDTAAPVFIDPCPVDIVETSSTTNKVVTYTVPGAMDVCGSASVGCVPPSGSEFGCGTTRVTCTATDGSLNTATCGFNVTISDAARPGLTITIDRAANTITVSWPITCTVYELEVTDSLGMPTPATWTLVPGPYPVVGSNYSITESVGTANKFFRLKTPTPP
jgi:hypothetical protein